MSGARRGRPRAREKDHVMRPVFIIALVAAIEGAAGVAVAGASAHVDPDVRLLTASQFLMIHAAAGVGLAALCAHDPPHSRWLAAVAVALQIGVGLFAADLCARVYAGAKLFPFAAPLGGGLTILAWLSLAVWSAVALTGSRETRRR